jgi:hypothetical protein
MIDTLYNEAQSTLNWLRQAPKSYKQWLSELRESEVRTLRGADNLVYVHRAQGRLEIIERLIKLEEELQKPKGVR